MKQPRVHARDLRTAIPGSYRRHEDLVEAILQYLAFRGIPATPIQTGPRVRPRPGGGFDLRKNPLQRGYSDVAGALPPHGRMLLIEGKTGRAKRSPAQVRLHARYAAAGALCLVVRDVKDLESALQGPLVHGSGGTR